MNERDLYAAALEKQDPAERAAFVASACGQDGDLRRRVERLLRLHGDDNFPEQPATAPGETVVPEPDDMPGLPRLSAEAVGGYIGPYKLLQRLGEGGMGMVWVAEQTQPVKRRVALKVIKPGMDSAQVLHRFEAERQALALMDHTNIARVLDAGSTPQGRPYFIMELVKGVPITKYCNELHLTLRQRLELFIPVCQALQHAHQKGVIHRDVKPSNVLVAVQDGVPVPKVIDFGVAKALHQRLTEQTVYTEIGQIIGTLEYMAPEQAELSALDVDTRADIYALGVLLYELLTGSTPLNSKRLRAAAYSEVVRLIKEEEPPRPSTRLTQSKESLSGLAAQRRTDPARLLKQVRGDLDWIVMKCLEKDRTLRYETANALARDLQRYLADEPVEARPPSATYRLRKVARRYRTALVIAGLFAALLLVGVLVSSWLAVRATVAERAAVAARDDEGRQRRQAEKQSEFAEQQRGIATKRADELALEDYINRVNRASREVQDDNIALAEDLLQGCPRERRGWEWHYVNRLCHAERLSVEVPAGGVYAIAYSPDGRQIATAAGGPFSLGNGGPNVELWDRETGRRRLALPGTEHHIWSLAFSPDGAKLAVGGRNHPSGRPQVLVCNAKTGEEIWSKQEPALPQAMSLAFSPDGKSLAAGFGEYSARGTHRVKLYEVATGKETAAFAGPSGGVNRLAFHPDGRHLAVAGSGVVEVWDVVARTKVHELRGHTNWVYGVAFSPDGKWLATGGWDRTIKFWDATTGVEQLTFFGHTGFVLDLAFSPDSRALVSTSEDRSVRLWEVPTGRPIGVFHGHTHFVQAVAFAPDGRELASGGMEGTLKVWDRRTSLPVVIEGLAKGALGLWYRRDGRRVVITRSSRDRVVSTGWDPSTGEADPALAGINRFKLMDEYLPYAVPVILPGVPLASALSPDGRLLARALRADVNAYETGKRSRSDATNTVEVLDTASGRVLRTLIGHSGDVIFIAFSPDGRRIATASYDRTIKLWDPATGREVFTLRGHTAGLFGLAFSPDGFRIVSGGIDDTARVWDATPLPAERLQAHEDRYRQKRMELKTLGDLTEAEASPNAGNRPSQRGRWDQAADTLGKFVEGDPNNFVRRDEHILSLVEAGNQAGVRRACADLLKRFGNTTDPAQADSVAWLCVLAPDAVADREAPMRLAEAALAGQPGSGSQRSGVLKTLGAALYRAGRFEEAVRRLEESIQAHGAGGDPKAFAFLALAHHQLGDREEAKRWLDKLKAYRPKEGFDVSRDDMDIQILQREAEGLISGSPAATVPTAPSR
jgi:WD40 repeat protein/serine/threonine protein kinase